MITDLFCCPICGETLIAEGGSYRCAARHSFDIARQGYVNLLTGKHGAQHGDNKEMLLARRAFLSAGYSAPLVEAVAETAARYAPPICRVLDAGCGECHYTAAIAKRLAERGIDATILGVDISREALALGARQNPNLALAVASIYRLPLADESVDMLFEIFAPHSGEEFARVLRPRGKLIMVIPGARHLFGLKEILYKTPYENEVADTALPDFNLLNEENVEGRITLETNEDVWNLFTMTPYFYRTSPADKEKLRAHASLETEISFKVLTYEKTK